MSKNKIPDFNKTAVEIKRAARIIASTESVIFFKSSFTKKGFTDTSFQAWKSSNSPVASRSLLIGKTLSLSDNIRKVLDEDNKIVIEAETSYAQIHNDGGLITVTEQMKKFFMAKALEAAGIRKGDKKYSNKIKTNKKAQFYMKLALMPLGKKIKIPKRQFMGESKTMMTKIEGLWNDKVDIVFKQHLND